MSDVDPKRLRDLSHLAADDQRGGRYDSELDALVRMVGSELEANQGRLIKAQSDCLRTLDETSFEMYQTTLFRIRDTLLVIGSCGEGMCLGSERVRDDVPDVSLARAGRVGTCIQYVQCCFQASAFELAYTNQANITWKVSS